VRGGLQLEARARARPAFASTPRRRARARNFGDTLATEALDSAGVESRSSQTLGLPTATCRSKPVQQRSREPPRVAGELSRRADAAANPHSSPARAGVHRRNEENRAGKLTVSLARATRMTPSSSGLTKQIEQREGNSPSSSRNSTPSVATLQPPDRLDMTRPLHRMHFAGLCEIQSTHPTRIAAALGRVSDSSRIGADYEVTTSGACSADATSQAPRDACRQRLGRAEVCHFVLDLILGEESVEVLLEPCAA